MFTAPVMLRPGQELRTFNVSRPRTKETARGREITDGYDPLGTIRAVLAQAKSEETERWRQLEHPITHKITKHGRPEFDIKPGDIFEYAGRRFYNQAISYDIGDLGHWAIFFCDERTDVV